LVRQQATIDQLEKQIGEIDSKLKAKRSEFINVGQANPSSTGPTIEEVDSDDLILHKSYYSFTPEQKRELDRIEKTKAPLYQQLVSARSVVDSIRDGLTERKKLETRLTEAEGKKEELAQKLTRIKDLISEGRINTLKQMIKEGRI
jgi:DNA repair exonuclease SbcCD ATPase subunit